MTQKEKIDQERVEAAANESVQKTNWTRGAYQSGFKAGVAWSAANPSDAVMALVEAASVHFENCEYRGYSLDNLELALEAFRKSQEGESNE